MKKSILLYVAVCLMVLCAASCQKYELEWSESSEPVKFVEHEFVDMGFESGTLWATMNIGADKPEDFGDYFAWGETKGYDAGKNYFGSETYKWQNGGYEARVGKKVTDGIEMELADDAANANWGDGWRIPSDDQMDELIHNSSSTWTTLNGVYGLSVKSRKNGKSIFLPAAGYRYGSSLSEVGSRGSYWLRSYSGSNSAVLLQVSNTVFSAGATTGCIQGFSVRPVILKSEVTFKSISLNDTIKTLYKGESDSLHVLCTPINVTPDLVWSSSDSTVAKVSQQGLVSYVSAGSAVITVCFKSAPNVSATCKVTCKADLKYVDLGLTSGTLWAICNVGASSPEEYGDYFAWGETTGYNTGKRNFDWSAYKWCDGSSTALTKYCTSSRNGTVDDKTELELADDAAYVNWGSGWRMPSEAQQVELQSECIWTWTTQSGVNGYKVSSRKNGNSIFLPAAGYCYSYGLSDAGYYCGYWSRSLETPFYCYCAYHIDFYSGSGSSYHYAGRCCGRSVRPVNLKEISVQSIAIDKETLKLYKGDSETLSVTVTPTKATPNLLWSSSDSTIAWVTQSGVVSYVSEGTVTITVSVESNPSISATCTVTCGGPDGEVNGHAYIDLGLTSGTLWATCNIGADNSWDYGDYFAWGETTGYNGGKTNFSWSTYKWCNGSAFTLTKYCMDSQCGTVDGKTELYLADDAAYVNWGSGWRMPSSGQTNELLSECNWVWTTQNSVKGYKFTSKKNGNSIFLPAAGLYGFSSRCVGSDGYYWSRSLKESSSDYAYGISLYSYGLLYGIDSSRCYGLSVRPIVEKEIPVQSIAIDKETLKLYKGDSETLSVTVTPTDANQQLVWNSSDAGVAEVTQSGVVSYVSEGTATITVSVESNPSISATCTVTCGGPDGEVNGHAYIDLGLTSGTLWGTCNIGADNSWDYGDYFAWGETTGYNSGKTEFYMGTYKWWNASEYTKYSRFDNKTELELADDAAYVNWGLDWRIPSKAQQDELRSECNWTWTTQNSVHGYKVSSKKNNNSIFLPAAGYRYGSSLYNAGSFGIYWSRSLKEKSYNRDSVYCGSFYTSNLFTYTSARERGQSVRPIVEKEIPVQSIAIDKETLKLYKGDSETLSVTVTPTNANQQLVWSSSDAGVAEVTQSGVVSYVSEGTATITVSVESNPSISATCTVICKVGEINGHAYVDLGLTSGTLWATMNVGASSPEDYGDYFAWGETAGYNSGKTNFDWSTYKWCNGSETTMTKYCTSSSYGTVDNKTELELSDDAARANWGSSWRMPSLAQIDELRSECNWTWTTQGGVKGWKVASKKNGNSIFLPAVGFRGGSSLYNAGSYGLYWSRSLYESGSNHAYILYFSSGYFGRSYDNRYYGQSVRPVASE